MMGRNNVSILDDTVPVEVVGNSVTADDVILETALSSADQNAFYYVDVADVITKVLRWREELPRVEPFYAMKCNGDIPLLRLLAALGVKFACTNKSEIQTALNVVGVATNQLLFANPCKMKSHIQFAARAGVDLMTFDNVPELYKIKRDFPETSPRLMIRLNVDESDSDEVPTGLKFGVSLDTAFSLLCTAKYLQLNVVGVSFDLGSTPGATYRDAMELVYCVFNTAAAMGFTFDLLDIGGGFPGSSADVDSFQQVAADVNAGLNEYFPPGSGVRVIGEPGPYFVRSAFTLVANVISSAPSGISGGYTYHLNDSVYGSFNSCLYEDRPVVPTPLINREPNEPLFPCTLWGQSFETEDRISGELALPCLRPGDWLCFRDMGADTLSQFSPFNAFQKPTCHYFLPQFFLDYLSVKDRRLL